MFDALNQKRLFHYENKISTFNVRDYIKCHNHLQVRSVSFSASLLFGYANHKNEKDRFSFPMKFSFPVKKRKKAAPVTQLSSSNNLEETERFLKS